MGLIRSRIHQFINKELMKELKDICTDVLESNNNAKVTRIKDALDRHEVPYNELGPGTNRMAVLIDGYVFKIAMDKWGVRDNDNEFAMTEILQPFVINVYETNGLISVSEYVTLISREEFAEKKNDILKILHTLSQGFLLGDVGYHPKNFTNWGYRTDGDLVILDFAYIYNIVGDELLCPKDGNLLNYDENFHNLRCPYCKKKYTFMDVRRKVTREHEDLEIKRVKDSSYSVINPVTVFEDKDEEEKINKPSKEEVKMEKEYSDEKRDELFEDILETFNDKEVYEKAKEEVEEVEIKPEVPEGGNELEDMINLMEKVYHDEEDECGEKVTEDTDGDYDHSPVNPLETFLAAHGYNEEEDRDDDEPSVEVTVKETTEVTVKVRDEKPEVQEAELVEDNPISIPHIEEDNKEIKEDKNTTPEVIGDGSSSVEDAPESNECEDEDVVNDVYIEDTLQLSGEELTSKEECSGKGTSDVHLFKVKPLIKEHDELVEETHIDRNPEITTGEPAISFEEPIIGEDDSMKETGIVRIRSINKEAGELIKENQEQPKTVTINKTTESKATIRRLTPSSAEETVHEEKVVEEVNVNEEDVDLFSSAIQQARKLADEMIGEDEQAATEEDDISKYEDMAESYLGHDPYDH